ncbi:hypothetical protein [Salipaludibacillus sp. CF4.18]|uniref:hypothetical protein n=1 Tax=Salipaludibacillus sp. CF4.18 TaxID=3373081 RepID=UPI003EE51377
MRLKRKVLISLIIFSFIFSVGGVLHINTMSDMMKYRENEDQYEGFQLDEERLIPIKFEPREYIRVITRRQE